MRIPKTVIERGSCDDLLVIDTKGGFGFGCNDVGAGIWKAIREGADADTIARNMARGTDENLEKTTSRVRAFVDVMKAFGAVDG